MEKKRKKLAIIVSGLVILLLISGLVIAAAEDENQTEQAQGLRRGQRQGLRQGQGQGLRRGAAIESETEETANNQGLQRRAGQELQSIMQELTPEQRQAVRRVIAQRLRRQAQVRRTRSGIRLDLSLEVPNRTLQSIQTRRRLRQMNSEGDTESEPQTEIETNSPVQEQASDIQDEPGTGNRAGQRQGAGRGLRRGLQQNTEFETE